jgi:hypothetical protein
VDCSRLASDGAQVWDHLGYEVRQFQFSKKEIFGIDTCFTFELGLQVCLHVVNLISLTLIMLPVSTN